MVGARLPVKYRKTLEKMAEEEGVSISEVVRRIIIRHLESSIEERLESIEARLDSLEERVQMVNLQAMRTVLLVIQHNLESHELSPDEREKWLELKRELEGLEKEAKKMLECFKREEVEG